MSWAAIPRYESQPIVDLTPTNAASQLFGYFAQVRPFDWYRAANGVETFSFNDSTIGAVHLLTLVQVFSGSTSEDKLRIRLGDRYSLVVRARRHVVSEDGRVGDGIILGSRVANSGTVHYLEAAIQDSNADLQVRILHGIDALGNALPTTSGMHIAVGYAHEESSGFLMYAHIAGQPRFGSNTYSMRLSVDYFDAMDGDRQIVFTDAGNNFAMFQSAAAKIGPFLETHAFRPDSESFRRERANRVVASLRSRALNWGYTLNPPSNVGIAKIDCAGHVEFEQDYDTETPRRYVAALNEHPDGEAAYVKPAVAWNSNVGFTAQQNEFLASLQIRVPSEILVRRFLFGVLQQNVFGFTTQAITIDAGTDNCGNNEYIGTAQIDMLINDNVSAMRYIRANAFAGISAVEEVGNRNAASFAEVTLGMRYRAVVHVFLVDEDDNVQTALEIDQELSDEQVTALLQGQEVELLDAFNDKTIVIQGLGA